PRAVVGRRSDDGPLALDRLDEDGDGLVAHGGGHRRQVVVGDEADARQQRLEAALVLLLPGGGERGERPPVEGARGGEDVVASAAAVRSPAAGELQPGPVPPAAALSREGPPSAPRAS